MKVIILILLLSISAVAQTPAQIRTTVDSWLAARVAGLQTKQTTYASNHSGRFFQGLKTHTVVPSDGIDSTADNLAAHPTDQTESWNSLSALPTAFPCTLIIDVYKNSNGWGYVVTLRVTITSLGKTWERAQNFVGNESYRTYAWRQVPDNPIN